MQKGSIMNITSFSWYLFLLLISQSLPAMSSEILLEKNQGKKRPQNLIKVSPKKRSKLPFLDCPRAECRFNQFVKKTDRFNTLFNNFLEFKSSTTLDPEKTQAVTELFLEALTKRECLGRCLLNEYTEIPEATQQHIETTLTNYQKSRAVLRELLSQESV